MLVFKILSTVFLGISFLTALLKNIALFDGTLNGARNSIVISVFYSFAWRVLAILTIWSVI